MTELRDRRAAKLLGMGAVVFSVLYLASDVIESVQGGFTPGQLWMTLVAEAAVPVVVIGMYLIQRPEIGRLGMVSASAYAYAFVYFSGTVVYALAHAVGDYDALSHRLGSA